MFNVWKAGKAVWAEGGGRRKNQEFLPLRVPRRARGEGEGRGPRPPIPTNYIKKTRRWVEVDTPRSAVELVPRRGTFAGGGETLFRPPLLLLVAS